MSQPDVNAAKDYLLSLQDSICDGLAAVDGKEAFRKDNWQPEHGSPEAVLYDEFLKPKDWLANN